MAMLSTVCDRKKRAAVCSGIVISPCYACLTSMIHLLTLQFRHIPPRYIRTYIPVHPYHMPPYILIIPQQPLLLIILILHLRVALTTKVGMVIVFLHFSLYTININTIKWLQPCTLVSGQIFVMKEGHHKVFTLFGGTKLLTSNNQVN